MKKFTLTIAAFAMYLGVSNAQSYCNVTTAIAYAPTMPGVTGFTLNTITRNSAGLECSGSCNSVVNTNMTTTLVAGQNYTVKMNHNDDPSIAPNMNLRVWIDFNKNGTLNDAGETCLTVDNHVNGVYTATFTVPSGATLGSTKMRITAKMPQAAGHTAPTPCDSPPDPLGYHGEIEDYTVVLSAATGINEISSSLSAISVYPNPFSTSANLSYNLQDAGNVSVEVYNVLGEKVTLVANENQTAGNHIVKIDTSVLPKSNGMYYVKVSANGTSHTTKVMSVN